MSNPDRYAVIGNPIAHSRSPFIHTEFAKTTQQNLIYERLLAPLEGFKETAQQFFREGGKGLNVTLPFKEQAYALADVLSLRAKQAGAVNTLLMGKNGLLYGDNTDGAGLVRDLTVNLAWSLASKRILVLGAGGAVRGVLGPLLAIEPAHIYLANRTQSKADHLATLFAEYGSISATPLEQIPLHSIDVIINGSSASLAGESLQLPDGLLTDEACAYDMAYGKAELPFLQWAKTQGARSSDGLGMLVEQAAESFFIWRNVRVATGDVLAQLKIAVSQSVA